MSYHQFVSNGIIENGKVRNSEITTSTIDMNNDIIHSHAQPILDSDVVNKIYVDNRIRSLTINLLNTSPSFLLLPPSSSTILSGSLIINIVYISGSNGPSATFHLNKSNVSASGSIHRTNVSAGSSTLERLMMSWLPNESPKIYKTGSNYNGLYQIFIIPNFILI